MVGGSVRVERRALGRRELSRWPGEEECAKCRECECLCDRCGVCSKPLHTVIPLMDDETRVPATLLRSPDVKASWRDAG